MEYTDAQLREFARLSELISHDLFWTGWRIPWGDGFTLRIGKHDPVRAYERLAHAGAIQKRPRYRETVYCTPSQLTPMLMAASRLPLYLPAGEPEMELAIELPDWPSQDSLAFKQHYLANAILILCLRLAEYLSERGISLKLLALPLARGSRAAIESRTVPLAHLNSMTRHGLELFARELGLHYDELAAIVKPDWKALLHGAQTWRDEMTLVGSMHYCVYVDGAALPFGTLPLEEVECVSLVGLSPYIRLVLEVFPQSAYHSILTVHSLHWRWTRREEAWWQYTVGVLDAAKARSPICQMERVLDLVLKDADREHFTAWLEESALRATIGETCSFSEPIYDDDQFSHSFFAGALPRFPKEEWEWDRFLHVRTQNLGDGRLRVVVSGLRERIGDLNQLLVLMEEAFDAKSLDKEVPDSGRRPLSKEDRDEQSSEGKILGTQGGTMERVRSARQLIEQGETKTRACKRAHIDPRTYDRYVEEIIDWEAEDW